VSAPHSFTEEAARKTSEAVRRVLGQPANPRHGPAAPPPVVSVPVVHVVRVTSTTPTDGRYPGKVQAYDAAAKTWSDLADCWVVNPNGSAPAAQRYNARFVGAAGSPEYGVFSLDVAGASGITVEAVDGTPSYTGVTTLRFDELDGYSLSNPAAGVARVDHLPASATQAGVVDLANQVLGDGVKAIQDALMVGSTTVSLGTTYCFIVATGHILLGSAVPISWSTADPVTSLPSQFRGQISSASNLMNLNVTNLTDGTALTLSLTSNNNRVTLAASTAGGAGSFCVKDSGGTTRVGAYGSFTTVDGKTVTVTGGIITAIV
jgi:hypothetical protein